MIRIPAGKIIYGLSESQRAELAKSQDVHPDMLYFHADRQELEVKEFWIDRCPVTRGQFRRFQEETGYQIVNNGWEAGWGELTGWREFAPEDDALPMVGVSADDANAYAEWCGKRLPTELEWEAAWRGSDGRLFPWGEEWKENATFRSPGNVSLKVPFPVGTLGAVGPHGLNNYSLVVEWVKNLDLMDGRINPERYPWVLAGGSFIHTKEYSFCPTHRSAWATTMRIYNAGFRCVADRPVESVAPVGAPLSDKAATPHIVSMRRDLYKKEPIELIPTDHATIRIKVPWFPESVWVLDCPEMTWGEFGGANDWPARGPEAGWKIDWQRDPSRNAIGYVREKDGKRQKIEIWAEGDTVTYRYETKGVAAVPNSFCFKTFSPFFTSQERCTQALMTPHEIIPCCQRARITVNDAPLYWAVGLLHPPDRAVLQSFDKTARILFPPVLHAVGGNGCYPCVHVQPRGFSVTPTPEEAAAGGMSIQFSMV